MLLDEMIDTFQSSKENYRMYERLSTFDEMNEMVLTDSIIHRRSRSSTHIRNILRLFGRFCHWILTHRLHFVLLVIFILPFGLYVFLLLLSTNSALIPQRLQVRPYNLLLVTAHPDDECLFFAPTLRILDRRFHFNLSLLVFSRGNHKGLGETRALELTRSCLTLNIPIQRCVSLDLSNVKDDPKIWWPEEQLIPTIEQFIRQWSIDFLVSFDHSGVSGHINHRAVGAAVRSINKNKNSSTIQMSYELKSVSLLRKYSSWMDFYVVFFSLIPRLLHSFLSFFIPFHWFPPVDSSRALLISSPADYLRSRSAFACHQTQFSWDRHIYLITSRYMLVNELHFLDDH